MRPHSSATTVALAFALLAAPAQSLAAQDRSAVQRSAREIFAELIGINTDGDSGSTTIAAQAMAKRLIAAGFPSADVKVVGPATSPKNWNLVARYRGTGKGKPILLMAHLDVVTARASDWSLPPYQLTEKDGFLYGRGTSDQKNGCALLVASLVQMKKEGIVPDRDLILALTAGEEGGMDYVGMEWLVNNQRSLIDAEFAWNVDAGDPQLQRGKRVARVVQAAEKVYATFALEATNVGGHSSLPTKDNAIVHVTAAVGKIAAHDFPVHLSEITRGWLTQMTRTEKPEVAKDIKSVLGAKPDPAAIARLSKNSLYNAQMRTTCVPTQFEAGHAENALPQKAKATINCRILPSESADDVKKTLARLIGDSAVHISAVGAITPSPPSPLTPAVLAPIQTVTERFYPKLPIVPLMETGATDGIFLRNAGIPTYGISALFLDVDDIRAHGRDERIIAAEFDRAAEYQLALLKAFVTVSPIVP
jgi:acetylornithine deacetylase/succinyl-diaminopimelate desuccinylase-like protein